jgi:hypothetical protein
VEHMSEDTVNAAARHVKGTTIAWGGGNYLDILDPQPDSVSIEDYAYALAYTVRWRGQTWSGGKRVFFGVGEHVVRGAEQLLRDGHGPVHAFAFLGHESDEVPFGDTPGPIKQLWSDEYRAAVKRCGQALDKRFGFTFPDPDLIKRYDIRMLVTEKRDLLIGHDFDVFSTNGDHMADDRYAAFEDKIVPYAHPDQAAQRFLTLHHQLKGLL